MRSGVALSAGILCWALPCVARAGPPLITDDPGTPGPNRWEVNLAGTLEYGPSQYTIEGPLLDVNYGVGERWQLKVECPWVWTGQLRHSASSSIGNPAFGVKWRFLDQHANGIDLAAYPQFDFNPITPHEHGLFERGTELLFPLEIAWSTGKWQLYGDVGFDGAIGQTSLVWAGVAALVEVTDGLEVTAEIHVEIPVDGSSADLAANAGLTYELDETFTLLASGGTAAWTGGPDALAYLGLQSHL